MLLVRPHPSEGVKEYFGTPNEYFVDLIEKPSKQTIYLDPSLVELSDFIDQLDAGLMWFGTAGIELAACGVPVVYCSKWTETDYVLPALNKPSSKEEYHRWINDPASLRLSKEIARSARSILSISAKADLLSPSIWPSFPRK